MPSLLQQADKFFHTPKGYLLLLLWFLCLIAIPGAGFERPLANTAAAVAVAALLDLSLTKVRIDRWLFPSGAILTGLIVALVLSPQEPLHILIATVVAAICSKYIFRNFGRPVFNPAAFGLLLAGLFFSSGESWWGGLAGLSPLLLLVLVGCGLIIVERVNKYAQVLAFFGTYFGLCSLAAFLGDPSRVAEAFRDPFLNSALFFGFFMLTDPPTSPGHTTDQIQFGILVAIISFIIYMMVNQLYFLLIGLLAGNLWFAWHHHQKMLGIQRSKLRTPTDRSNTHLDPASTE